MKTIYLVIITLICSSIANGQSNVEFVQKINISTENTNLSKNLVPAFNNNTIAFGDLIDRHPIDIAKYAKYTGSVKIYKLDEKADTFFFSEIIYPTDDEGVSYFGQDIGFSGDDLYVLAQQVDRTKIPTAEYLDTITVYRYAKNFGNERYVLIDSISHHTNYKKPNAENSLIIDDKHLFIHNKMSTSDDFEPYFPGNLEKIHHYIKDYTDESWTKKNDLDTTATRDFDIINDIMSFANNRIAFGKPTIYKTNENGDFITDENGGVFIYSYQEDNDSWILENKITPFSDNTGQNLGAGVKLYNSTLFAFQKKGQVPNKIPTLLGRSPLLNIIDIWSKDGYDLKQQIFPISIINMDAWDNEVAIEGEYMAIAASGEYLADDGENTIIDAGAVYLYKLDQERGLWKYNSKIVSENPEKDAKFGDRVNIYGNKLYIMNNNHERNVNNDKITSTEVELYVYKIDTTRSSVKAIDENKSTPRITISPNPISDVTTIGIPAVGDVRVYLTDITGATVREIWTGNADVPTSVMMDATGLATGEYFVVLESSGGFLSEKIVVGR